MNKETTANNHSETSRVPLPPRDRNLAERQRALRREAARAGEFSVAELSDRWAPGQYTVSSAHSKRCYRVSFHGPENEWNNCDCPDFRTSMLGTCKHIEAVRLYLDDNGLRPVSVRPERSALYISYTGGRRLKLHLGQNAPDALAVAAMRYFDDEMVAEPGMVAHLPAFIENARKIDPQFHCYPDALNYILEARDRARRAELLAGMSPDTFAGVLRTPLYPFQAEGVRRIFDAGKVLLADEMGLGKTVQALGAAELFRQSNMIGGALIVCPTSLKYQWKKEIERFTTSSVTVVEGVSDRRRELYADESFYKIVSYHSLANDVKVMGSLRFDMLVLDEVQRLKNWNTQISQAARRLESDYSVVISGTPLENRLEELYSVMQLVDQYALGPYYLFVDRYVETDPTGRVTGYRNLGEIRTRLRDCLIRRRRADVAPELPERSDKTLYVPLTREQREIHDSARAAVGRLAAKWQSYRFLSEKDRKRLLQLLSRMRMVCDSTFVIDQKTRFDTKPGEALQLVSDMLENYPGAKAVIFSQWERMTRVIAEELDKAGIGYEYLHGGVAARERRHLTERFNTDPDKRVFISTDAGSTGLNLQAGSLVINLDMPWNPAVIEQRIARIHRLGQQQPVQVINMVATDSIEEQMISTLSFKADLFEGVFDGGEDRVILDDSRLSRIVEAVTSPPRREATESQAGIEAATPLPDPDELLRRAGALVRDIASYVARPGGAKRFADALARTNLLDTIAKQLDPSDR